MVMEWSEKREVLQIRDGVSEVVSRSVVKEVSLTVFVNGLNLVTLLTTGDSVEELAVGFLLSEGLLGNRGDLLSIQVEKSGPTAHLQITRELEHLEELRSRKTVTCGGGRGTTFHRSGDLLERDPVRPDFRVAPAHIYALMEELNGRSSLHRETGGVHSSALANTGGILFFREDIGRHNAVDKIHGACFFKGVSTAETLLLTTGRISSEMVVKASRMGVPVLISRSAPTSLAIDLAEREDLTLAGYARGRSMVVYTGKGRIGD